MATGGWRKWKRWIARFNSWTRQGEWLFLGPCESTFVQKLQCLSRSVRSVHAQYGLRSLCTLKIPWQWQTELEHKYEYTPPTHTHTHTHTHSLSLSLSLCVTAKSMSHEHPMVPLTFLIRMTSNSWYHCKFWHLSYYIRITRCISCLRNVSLTQFVLSLLDIVDLQRFRASKKQGKHLRKHLRNVF